MRTSGLPIRTAIAILVAIMMFGAGLRLALVEIGDGARVDAFCVVDSDFWRGDLILC